MAAVPPNIPGQGKDSLFGVGFWLAMLILVILAIPSFGIASMLMEIVYPGQWKGWW